MTEKSISLFDLRGLSKPVSKLIDAVSQCFGTLYEPRKIRRKAKAEADAKLLLTKADIECQRLLKRAGQRLAFQEVRRQANIERIVELAAKSLPENVSEEPIDPDWVSRFFDECKDVSNKDLQALWARILAGEVEAPGSCSRKTLSILKNINHADANMFKKICSLIWKSQNHYFFPVGPWFGGISPQLRKYDMDYDIYLHLDHIGLIHCDIDVYLEVEDSEELSYFGKRHISYNYPTNSLSKINALPLTISGCELFHIANPEPNWSFYIDSIDSFSASHIYLASHRGEQTVNET